MIKSDNDTITYVKAVGIMLMVLAHCSNFSYVYYTVYMFHMPLFFLVSGYCFKEKYYSCPHTFVWKRIKGLWWPFVKWSLLFLLLHNTLHEINIYSDNYGYLGNGVHKYSQSEIIGHSKSIIFLMEGSDAMVGGFWFLKSLFFGSLFAFFLLLFLNRIAVYFGYGKKSVTAFAGGYIPRLLPCAQYCTRHFDCTSYQSEHISCSNILLHRSFLGYMQGKDFQYISVHHYVYNNVTRRTIFYY